MFKHPVSTKEIRLPKEVILRDGRALKFKSEKTSGVTTGGWYGEKGEDFLIKFGQENPAMIFRERLLTNLARICLDEVLVSLESTTGTCDLEGKPSTFIASKKIDDFREMLSIKGSSLADSIRLRQLHAQKFHPAFVYSALISYDDLNEENLGLSGQDCATIVDYETMPSFLYSEQSEHRYLPFSLASFIGHQSPVGMQLVRKRYFENISQFSVFKAMKKIIENQGKLFDEIEKTILEVRDSQGLGDEQRSALLKFCTNFKGAVQERISWMNENFTEELSDLEERSHELKEKKWTDHPRFRELMEREAKIFKACSERTHHKNLEEIAKIIGIEEGNLREKILEHKCNDSELSRLKEFINDKQNRNFVLHNAIICGDARMVEWLIDNDLCDINETYWNRKHNYQLFRLTPLSTVIALKKDGEKYDVWRNENNDEMIRILREKFCQVNGNRDVSRESNHDLENGQGDKLAIWLTRRAIMLDSQTPAASAAAASATPTQYLQTSRS